MYQKRTPKRIETQNIELYSITKPSTTSILTQEERKYIELIKKMSGVNKRQRA